MRPFIVDVDSEGCAVGTRAGVDCQAAGLYTLLPLPLCARAGIDSSMLGGKWAAALDASSRLDFSALWRCMCPRPRARPRHTRS